MKRRQNDLAVVLDHVDDPHNIGAILRSCDAFGVGEVHLLYVRKKAPRMSELKSRAAASAVKWLAITPWDSAAKLIRHLRRKKMTIATTALGAKAMDPRAARLTKPVALVIGNEHEGVSPQMAKAADVNLVIPMRGFVKSFNVSVATAILLYEIVRQRET